MPHSLGGGTFQCKHFAGEKLYFPMQTQNLLVSDSVGGKKHTKFFVGGIATMSPAGAWLPYSPSVYTITMTNPI